MAELLASFCSMCKDVGAQGWYMLQSVLCVLFTYKVLAGVATCVD